MEAGILRRRKTWLPELVVVNSEHLIPAFAKRFFYLGTILYISAQLPHDNAHVMRNANTACAVWFQRKFGEQLTVTALG